MLEVVKKTMMRYQVKHLGLGGILDQSFRILQDNFRLFFRIVLFTLMPFQLVLGFLQESMQQSMAQGNQAPIQMASILILTFFVGIPLSIFVTAATMRAVGRVYLSHETSAGDAFRHATQRFWPLVGTFVLTMVVIFGGTIVCMVPGIIVAVFSPVVGIFGGAILCLLFAIVCAIFFSLAQPVTVLESKWGGQALKRSWALMKGHTGAGIALGVVLTVLVIEIGAMGAIIPQSHLRIVATAIAQAMGTLLQTTTLVVFYYSCRCHREDYDLWLLADAIQVEDDPVPDEVGLSSA